MQASGKYQIIGDQMTAPGSFILRARGTIGA
jgi:hypothetical protein